jgi:hypothetical protein
MGTLPFVAKRAEKGGSEREGERERASRERERES